MKQERSVIMCVGWAVQSSTWYTAQVSMWLPIRATCNAHKLHKLRNIESTRLLGLMHVVVEQMTSSTAPVEEKRSRDSATTTAAGTSSCEEASEEGRTVWRLDGKFHVTRFWRYLEVHTHRHTVRCVCVCTEGSQQWGTFFRTRVWGTTTSWWLLFHISHAYTVSHVWWTFH
jgi:hypothetical protein